LNAHEINNIRQTAIYTADPMMPEHNASEVETATEKLKGYVTRY
jgi:hypothetical protein